ncbi:pilus assembly protein [Tahibacter harae]|uniref:PilC/PilY family type IV pilus protein n=1 Tax=Tahibacter harae TaxID=2963937 RepID=A0ABT1QMM2_9GAMM|nr:PilC/PilY family type IV pilus protein [Tahibacter harae]MCQ4163776.1 PilC/PilY family type IV pilus protein [Tahibacter harae]
MLKHFLDNKSLPALAAALATVLAGLSAPTAFATTVDLGSSPPDISSAVNPNVVVTFDDSGSMGATALPDSMSDDYNKKYYYDPRQNLIYFDPLKDYPPPLRPDGTAFPDATYTAAWRDGICANWSGSYCYGAANTRNLSTQFHQNFANETSTTNRPNSTTTTLAAIPTGVRGSITAGFWFECPTSLSETGCVMKVIGTAADPKPAPAPPAVAVPITTRFANWYAYYRTRNLMTRTALSRVFGGTSLDNKVRVIWQTINADYGSTPAIRSREVQDLTGTWKQNFFNWMFDVTNNGGTPNRRATIEAGKVFERTLTSNYMNPYWYPPLVAGGTGRSLECRQNFHMLVTDGYWNEGDPGLPTPYLKVSDSFTLPDGKAYAPGTADTKVYSNVGNYDSSIANIGFNYWARDLQPSLDNKVPAFYTDRTAPSGVVVPPTDPGSVAAVYWNPANDPATWQHVVQYMVTLGIAGNLSFPGDYAALRAGTKAWPTPSNNSPPAVDDTWHAAVNSRGEYFSAKNPTELVDQMTTILTSILTRRGGSTSPAVSTGVLTSNTLAFSAGYDSADWSGFLLGQEILSDGTLLSPPKWDASCRLTGGPCASTGNSTNAAPNPTPANRVILTSDSTVGSGKPFRWSALSAVQQAALQLISLPSTLDTRGAERVDYLRGVRTSESLAGAQALRKRGSVLGAVVNAQPRFYGPVEGTFTDDFPVGSPEYNAATSGTGGKFSDFRRAQLSRKPRVYMAANDGMLHAFDASDGPDGGLEKWAFVPNTLIMNGKMKKLTEPAIGLLPTVDDRPVIGEVFRNGSWRSLLVGSLRFGGRGIYALDITSPDATEANAASKVLWEFNNLSPGGANLGYTYDSANVARLRNGKWVVLVSSGYFPAVGPDSTAPAALLDRTSLFVIDLETGLLLREIQTPAGVRSYGLSGPEVVGYGNGEFRNVDDFAVAGDLAGNLWRFDLTDASPANWSVDLMFSTYDNVAADVGKQPITVTPIAFGDKRSTVGKGAILVFGTGKYLGDSDRLAAGTPTQSYYGIKDMGKGMTRITKAELVEQTMVRLPSGTRTLTNLPVPGSSKGWRFNFPVLGERNVVTLTPVFANGTAIFSTVIPAGDNPCDPARTGAIIVVDAQNGTGPGTLLNEAFGGASATANAAGKDVANPPAAGALGAVTAIGGGAYTALGLTDAAGNPISLNVIPVWRRGSWREALDFNN